MSQIKNFTLKKLEEVRFDKMTADELKAAYETAKAIEADKAQEAEIFKRAHEIRVKKEQMMAQQKEQEMNTSVAQQEEGSDKKPHSHKKHHKKSH